MGSRNRKLAKDAKWRAFFERMKRNLRIGAMSGGIWTGEGSFGAFVDMIPPFAQLCGRCEALAQVVCFMAHGSVYNFSYSGESAAGGHTTDVLVLSAYA